MTATQVSGYTTKSGIRRSGYTQSRQSATVQPKHRFQGQAQLSIAGGTFLLLYSLIELLYVTVSTLTALLVALTVTLLGFAGWMKTRQVRSTRRKAVRHVRRTTRRVNGRRSRSPAMYQAATDRKVKLREQRHARRDEVWGRRKAAAVSAARLGVAKVRQGWSQ